MMSLIAALAGLATGAAATVVCMTGGRSLGEARYEAQHAQALAGARTAALAIERRRQLHNCPSPAPAIMPPKVIQGIVLSREDSRAH